MTDKIDHTERVIHAFIRAASSIEHHAQEMATEFRRAETQLASAKRQLAGIEIMRSQITVLAQKLSGNKHIRVDNLSRANDPNGFLDDQELFREAMESAAVIRGDA